MAALSDVEREQLEVFAKDRARTQFKKANPRASDAEAWQFAFRHWQAAEFIQDGAEMVALIRELSAAPLN